MNEVSIWLQYGLNASGDLVAIDDSERGKHGLRCPYCSGDLVAKKGRVVTPHFAHAGQTCAPVERREDAPRLPMYDRFDLQLGAGLFDALRKIRTFGILGRTEWHDYYIDSLTQLGLIKWTPYNFGSYELTRLGKIPFGDLSLRLFCEEQEPRLLEGLAALEARAADPAGDHLVQIDLAIYTAQLRRILASTLYFLEVQADGRTFHKIGVTTRTVEERVKEILIQLRGIYRTVEIKVVGTWLHRGNVELYFKHRYARERAEFGNLTEYFTFEDPKAVLRDLRRMPAKKLNAIEERVLCQR